MMTSVAHRMSISVMRSSVRENNMSVMIDILDSMIVVDVESVEQILNRVVAVVCALVVPIVVVSVVVLIVVVVDLVSVVMVID